MKVNPGYIQNDYIDNNNDKMMDKNKDKLSKFNKFNKVHEINFDKKQIKNSNNFNDKNIINKD